MLMRWYFTERIDNYQWNIYFSDFLGKYDNPCQVLYSKGKTSVISVCYEIHICRTMSLWLPYHKCWLYYGSGSCWREGIRSLLMILRSGFLMYLTSTLLSHLQLYLFTCVFFLCISHWSRYWIICIFFHRQLWFCLDKN